MRWGSRVIDASKDGEGCSKDPSRKIRPLASVRKGVNQAVGTTLLMKDAVSYTTQQR